MTFQIRKTFISLVKTEKLLTIITLHLVQKNESNKSNVPLNINTGLKI